MGVRLGETMQGLMDGLELRQARGLVGGLKTGLTDLDDLTGGGQPGHLWLVNGISGVGKTTFALGLARHGSLRQAAEVKWISTVEGPQDLAELVLSAEGRVPLHHLRMGALTDDDWARLARCMGTVAEAPLVITTVSPASLLEAAEQALSTQPRLLVIDTIADALDRDLLSALHTLARGTGIWTLVVTSDRPGLEPDDVDRAQAAVADVIVWLDRPDQDDHHSPRVGEADIVVTRSRYTPTSTITVAFQGHYARFVDLGSTSASSSG